MYAAPQIQAFFDQEAQTQAEEQAGAPPPPAANAAVTEEYVRKIVMGTIKSAGHGSGGRGKRSKDQGSKKEP